MLIGALTVIGLLIVPLFGGRLRRLAFLRLRWIPLVAAAFAVQILIVNVLPSGDAGLRAAVHIGTYAALALALARNLRLPGLPLIALGGMSNALAIVANDGVMPATAGALRTAGMTADPEAFTNSALVADARLQFLGDVFAVPAWVPAANVFSVGDLLLVLGAWVLAHRISGSRLFGRGRAAGPGLVLFDASGAVQAVTPQARTLLSRLDGRTAREVPGVVLPAEAFVVAGRARTLARGGGAPPPRAEVLDRRGRWLTFTASCFDVGNAAGPRTALAIEG